MRYFHDPASKEIERKEVKHQVAEFVVTGSENLLVILIMKHNFCDYL
jgi:hypothetical protein